MDSFEQSLNHLKQSDQFAYQLLVDSQLSAFPEALKQLSSSLQKSNQNVALLKDSLKMVLEREASLQEDFQKLKAKYENEAAQIRFEGEKKQKLKSDIEVLRKRIKDQQEELGSLHQKRLQANSKISELEIENRRLKGLLEQTQYSAQEEISQLELQLNAFHSQQIQSYKTQVNQLEKELGKTRQEKKLIQQNAQNNQIQMINQRKVGENNLRQKIQEAKQEAKKSQILRIELENQNRSIIRELKTLKKQSQKAIQQSEIKHLQQRQRIYQDLSSLQYQMESRQSEVSNSKQKFFQHTQALNRQIESLTQKISFLQQEKQDYLSKFAQLRSQMDQTRLKMKQLVLQQTQQAKKANRLQKQYESLVTIHTQTLCKLQQSQIQLKSLSNQNSNLKSQADHLQSIFSQQLQKADHQKSILQKQYKKAQQEYFQYQISIKHTQGEISLWKAALLQIACFNSSQKPVLQDHLRSLLGVAPQRLQNFDPQTKEYIDSLVARIKDQLMAESPTKQNSTIRLQQLLQQMTSKYRSQMAERRRLHALLQDIRGNIRVMCRVRPLLRHQRNKTECVQVMDTCQLKLHNFSNRRDSWFQFDRIFPATDPQEIIYYQASQLVTSVMNGFNACILAYGQTGSGKTHTMEGQPHSLGIIYRAARQIFDIVETREKSHFYQVAISILEVYNQQVRDLVRPGQKKIEIREDAKGKTHIQGVEVRGVSSYREIVDTIRIGQNNRSVGCTNINEYSSRSHSIITLYIQGNSQQKRFLSKLNLIDLAGSQRVWKSEAEGLRMQEACNINQSLSALGTVLYRLASKEKHIPYRDSKLTHILKDSFSGDAKTMMIVNISPVSEDAGESISSLQFGSRVACVEKGKAKMQIKKKKKKGLGEENLKGLQGVFGDVP